MSMSALALRVVVLCVAAAMLCAALRAQRPEFALALSLAAGLAAMLMAMDPMKQMVSTLQSLFQMANLDGETASIVLKATGIAILSELGVQICSDAGESALAGRIRLVTRIAILGLAAPLMREIMDGFNRVLGAF